MFKKIEKTKERVSGEANLGERTSAGIMTFVRIHISCLCLGDGDFVPQNASSSETRTNEDK